MKSIDTLTKLPQKDAVFFPNRVRNHCHHGMVRVPESWKIYGNIVKAERRHVQGQTQSDKYTVYVQRTRLILSKHVNISAHLINRNNILQITDFFFSFTYMTNILYISFNK